MPAQQQVSRRRSCSWWPLISRMVWVSSMTAMTESSDESFTMVANCPVSAGSVQGHQLGQHHVARRSADAREPHGAGGLELAFRVDRGSRLPRTISAM